MFKKNGNDVYYMLTPPVGDASQGATGAQGSQGTANTVQGATGAQGSTGINGVGPQGATGNPLNEELVLVSQAEYGNQMSVYKA